MFNVKHCNEQRGELSKKEMFTVHNDKLLKSNSLRLICGFTKTCSQGSISNGKQERGIRERLLYIKLIIII